MIREPIGSRISETGSSPRSADTPCAKLSYVTDPNHHFRAGRFAVAVGLACLFAVLLSGCTTYRVCPRLSDVPPGTPAVIDGQYQNVRIEKGRVYTTKNFGNGLSRNRVTVMEIAKTGLGQYTGQGESYNPQKRLSSFGPVTIDIVEPDKIRLTYRANALTGIKEGRTQKWTATKLDDEQGFLRELIRKPDVTLSARIHAATRITDRELLESLTRPDADPAVRLAAEVSLGRRTWEDIIGQAEREPTMVGPALAAIAWADNQSALAGRVTYLCHSYIRLGDVRYIPDLVELLRRYGDKLIAEDYMNCGQSDLDAAGREWARTHGYSVTSGPGSHRVRWGEGR